MIRHIVMFRFRSDVDEETRRQVREQFRADILSLRSQLDFIRSLEVGFNINPEEAWDICLESSFDSMDDLHTYSNFPNHRAAAAHLKPYLDGRCCVDHEV